MNSFPLQALLLYFFLYFLFINKKIGVLWETLAIRKGKLFYVVDLCGTGVNFGAVQNTDYRGTTGFCASFAVRFGFFIFLRYILNFFVARCTFFLRYREIINIKFALYKRIVISIYFNFK